MVVMTGKIDGFRAVKVASSTESRMGHIIVSSGGKTYSTHKAFPRISYDRFVKGGGFVAFDLVDGYVYRLSRIKESVQTKNYNKGG